MIAAERHCPMPNCLDFAGEAAAFKKAVRWERTCGNGGRPRNCPAPQVVESFIGAAKS
jgi:hypothetical protein